MKIGDVIKQVRENGGLQQWQVASLAGVSSQLVSAWERGERIPDPKTMVLLAEKLGDPEFLAEVSRDMSSGTFIHQPIDGPNADNSRLAVLLKAIEEAQEFVAALESLLPVAIRPETSWNTNDKAYVHKALHEALGCEGASEEFIRRFARLCDCSVVDLYREHDAERRAKGYIK